MHSCVKNDTRWKGRTAQIVRSIACMSAMLAYRLTFRWHANPSAEKQQADFATALTARINATKDAAITVQPSMSGIGVVINWKSGLKTA